MPSLPKRRDAMVISRLQELRDLVGGAVPDLVEERLVAQVLARGAVGGLHHDAAQPFERAGDLEAELLRELLVLLRDPDLPVGLVRARHEGLDVGLALGLGQRHEALLKLRAQRRDELALRGEAEAAGLEVGVRGLALDEGVRGGLRLGGALRADLVGLALRVGEDGVRLLAGGGHRGLRGVAALGADVVNDLVEAHGESLLVRFSRFLPQAILPRSRKAIRRPKMTTVSGMAMKSSARPRKPASSAVAPTAAAPIWDCAMPVPRPARPTARPAPMAIQPPWV